MQIHLVDGTYELFRHHFGQLRRAGMGGEAASRKDRGMGGEAASRNDRGMGGEAANRHDRGTGGEAANRHDRGMGGEAANRHDRGMGGVRGVLRSLLAMLEGGATHIAVATDHVIESFRNDLWPGYKSGAGVPSELLAQFHPLEDALRAMGLAVWPMVEFEADDALASGAAIAARDPDVERIQICTPDKDLAQSVVGKRVVLLDRRRGRIMDEGGVRTKFGVPPASIPDFLALVGDSADGYPGLPGWGAVSAARVLTRYGRLEAIPERAEGWDVAVRGAPRLARTLGEGRARVLLFRELATLRRDIALFGGVDELRWRGPRAGFREVAARLGDRALWERARTLAT